MSSQYARRVPYLTRELDLDHMSYAECAAVLGVTSARIGQLEARGLARMKRCFDLIESGVAIDDAVAMCRSRNGRANVNKASKARARKAKR